MAECKNIYYTATNSGSIGVGDFLYQNPQQTIPVVAGYYAWSVTDKWYQTDAEGVVIATGSCLPIAGIWQPSLLGSVLMGCISQSTSFGAFVDNRWNDSFFTASNNSYFVANTGTGSVGSQYPALELATASFHAYDFTKTYPYTDGAQTFISYPAVNWSDGSGFSGSLNSFTSQIWGAINLDTSASQNGLFRVQSGSAGDGNVWSVYTQWSGSENKLYITNLSQSVENTVTMSIVGGNYPMNRLSLYTIQASGSNWKFLSGSTVIGSVTHPKQFIINPNWSFNVGSDAAGPATASGEFGFPFNGFMNSALLYSSSIDLERIEQNTYSFINGFTSSINLKGCITPPIPTTTTTTTAAPTTTTTSTTTTTTSTTTTTTSTTTTSTTTTLAPQIVTRGLSSYLNFRNFFSASNENSDLWYDSVQLVSESACSRLIGIDSRDEGCGDNRPECGVYLTTGSFNAWDWPNVFNCNKSVFFGTGSFASSSNQTYVFYGAWDKDSNYGFVRNRNYQTALERANKIYSSGSNIVLETYWNNGTTHTLELPITASTFTSSSLSMLTVRIENGNTASVFQNGNLIVTKETSSLNFQSINQGYTYWLDSDDVSDYTMFAHSMLIYTASLTNNEISALSTAINNNITGSY